MKEVESGLSFELTARIKSKDSTKVTGQAMSL